MKENSENTHGNIPFCPAVVLGASPRGCGFASAVSGALVLEPEIVAAPQWTLTFDPGRNWNAVEPETDWGRELFDELRSRKALRGAALDNAAFAPVFTLQILARKLRVALDSRVLAVEGNVVRYVDGEGVHAVRAGRIVDTRPRFAKKKWFTALVRTPSPTAAGTYGPFELVPRDPDLAALLLPLAPDTGWTDARRTFRECWQNRPETLRDAAILLTAVRFAARAFADPVTELEQGIREAQDEKV